MDTKCTPCNSPWWMLLTLPIPVNRTRQMFYASDSTFRAVSPGEPRKSSGQCLTPPDSYFTFEEWADLPHRGCPFSVVLAQSQLHIEQGHPSDDKKQGVRDQKGTWRTQRQSVTPWNPASLAPASCTCLDQCLPEPKCPYFSALWPLPKGWIMAGKEADALNSNNHNSNSNRCGTRKSITMIMRLCGVKSAKSGLIKAEQACFWEDSPGPGSTSTHREMSYTRRL